MPVVLRLFLYFMYFKIASAILLDTGFGIFASAIYAIIFDSAETLAAMWIAAYSNPFEGRAALRPRAKRRARTVMLIGVIPVSILIAIGFAPGSINFHNEMWLDRAIDHPERWLIHFVVLMLQPVILLTIIPRTIKDKYPLDLDGP